MSTQNYTRRPILGPQYPTTSVHRHSRSPHPSQHHTLTGALAVLVSLTSQAGGAAFAKSLFPLVGPNGMTALRIGLSACLLLAVNRPWRSLFERSQLANLFGYGAVLGLMNLMFYQAVARIPLGIAAAIEVAGPLTVVLLSSRRPRDLAWFLAASVGLSMLLPGITSQPLDRTGVAFACGAAVCWALYIVFGKRVSRLPGRDAVSWGMLVASVLTLPLALTSVSVALSSPTVLLSGLAVALLSSAIPFSLEFEAMRRLPAQVFGILSSSAPAVAALAGFVALGERLTTTQWLAIACMVVACSGSALSSVDRES